MLEISYKKVNLKFKIPAKTSRGELLDKISYFLIIKDNQKNIFGIGEASPIINLSIDYSDDFEKIILDFCNQFNKNGEIPADFEIENHPSLNFAIETAMLDLEYGGIRKIANTDFFEGKTKIKINGLIWMSDKENMINQIKEKINNGFKCIKIKVGINIDTEIEILEFIRKNYQDIEIRLDANGAFEYEDSMDILKRFSKYNIHSIEQPIKPNQWGKLAKLCKDSPIPIALDEELINVKTENGKKFLLEIIKPRYIVLKPTLIGGFQSCKEWIDLANSKNIDWWITSALESNIGLNAIAQFTSCFDNNLHQGLGTGLLYENNINSPLILESEYLKYDKSLKWDLSYIINY
ncbi:MAG: o-succinylbenzoate synthase [Candidatus Sericytochromatia bacterium]|nr:MAG: o-succinylbenzoate synthase [Candidatus Sericytochromatia bacterium]